MIDLKKLREEIRVAPRLARRPGDLCDNVAANPLCVLELVDRCEAAEAALATARATAMEEAAAVARAQPYFPDTNVGKRQEWVKQEIAEKILKLAPLPPGLRAVPVETLGKLRKCLQPDQKKQRKVEAWAVVDSTGENLPMYCHTRTGAIFNARLSPTPDRWKAVRLVPYNYTADRVVKAAIAVCLGSDPQGEKWSALCRAVHAHKLDGRER